MRPITEPADAEYINGRQACLAIGCSPSALQRAVMLGEVRFKLEPGVAPRYHRGDVRRLAEVRKGASARLQPAGA